ncbi:alpha-L-rhamnosidase N-terminal domain-containing protein [Akkermansiaceae bacterium]|nr:alpha-L-rhamnosidase N-terminal domain-containing protein [Akkermansiaceae bacterium]
MDLAGGGWFTNSWVAFRKDVRIDKVPEKVVANISADSKYWMWINGELAVFEGSVARGPGPSRPWNRQKEMWTLPPETKPSNTWYEEVDITRYLKSGVNTIAVLVWYWGRETHKGTHIDSGKGGFIFQADINGKSLVSDRSWKVKADPAYEPERADTEKMVLQYNVNYDARKEMGGWTAPGFADAGWQPASEKGLPPSAPWYKLERNYVPALVNHGLKFYESHPESRFPFVTTGETIVCKLPFNQQITPYLEVECDGGLEIKVTTDNPLNRISAFYTTKPGRQAFEGYSWMNGHEVLYEIPKGVKVIGLKYRWMSVGEMAGSFECSDPFFERLWWMGRNTLFVCARDNFMDCPDRERACWIGDVSDQAGYLFYCMDESGRRLLEKAIRITMAYSHKGVFGALGPLRIRELPAQSLQFIEQGVWQYYLNTGDKESLRFAYPYVRAYLALWEMGENGLTAKRKPSMDSWNWFDWGQEGTIDQPVILDALYYMALGSAGKMARELGEDKDIAWYGKRMGGLKKGFEATYWKDGFYSSDPKKFRDDRANALAILSGLAPKSRHESIVERVLIPNRFCSPHFEWMVQEAMCVAGRHHEALARMKERYQSQVDRKGMTTLYENFPKGGSYNHAWNAPNTVLAKHIAGITPVETGWRSFQILPHLGHLTGLRMEIPSVMGKIAVDLKSGEKSFAVNLVSPAGTKAIVGIPKSPLSPDVIEVNGQVVWSKGEFKSGVEGVGWKGESDGFIRFEAAPGTWNISATAQ